MADAIDFKEQLSKLKTAKAQVVHYEQGLRETAIAHVKDILETAGLTVADVQGTTARARLQSHYRSAEGQEWSGFGRAPAWFNLETADSFLIPGHAHSAGVINRKAKLV